MSIHERYINLVEKVTGMSFFELSKASPMDFWKKLRGSKPIKVVSYFPITGNGGSVFHSVYTTEEANKEVDKAIASLAC